MFSDDSIKKIDFFEASKQLPIDKEEISRKISEVPLDIARGYIELLERNKRNIERTINLFRSIDGPFYHELLDQYTEEDLIYLNKIADYLHDENVLEKITELLNASMNKEPLTNHSKAKEIFNMLQDLGEDEIRDCGGKLIPFAWDMQRLSRILLFYLEKKGDENSVLSQLNSFSEHDLEVAISDLKSFIPILQSEEKKSS